MSRGLRRELLTFCEHDLYMPHRLVSAGLDCPGGTQRVFDFDAIWTRYYMYTNRRFKEGLTYNELYWVVYGEKKEEE